MESMLSDPRFVKEDYRTEDLLDFSVYTNYLRAKIDAAPPKSIFGIVGQYGTGKSVMLENLKARFPMDITWVHFEAWEYPERRNLWEGFVLELVRSLEPKRFNTTLQRFDGTSKAATKELIKSLAVAANVVVPGSGAAVDKLAYFASSSPATRIFQIQDMLHGLLTKHAKVPIYVVVEDADRSGDAGIYFIETLSRFLRNLQLDIDIKIFIPIAKSSFYSDKRDAYIKALDYVDFFELSARNLTKFVEKVFSPQMLTSGLRKSHVVELLQRLVTHHNLTIRDIKFIIRNSDNRYRSLHAQNLPADPLVVLLIEATRYINDASSSDNRVLWEVLRSKNAVPSGSQVGLLLLAVGMGLTVEDTVTSVNYPPSTVFRNEVRFIESDQYLRAGEQTSLNVYGQPLQLNGMLNLPRYYLE